MSHLKHNTGERAAPQLSQRECLVSNARRCLFIWLNHDLPSLPTTANGRRLAEQPDRVRRSRLRSVFRATEQADNTRRLRDG